GAILRGDSQSDAGAQLHDLIHPDRKGERLAHRIGRRQRGLWSHEWHEQGELVAPKTRHDDAFLRSRAQTLADLNQHLVAARIAERVVDLVESVEIERCEGERLVPATRGNGLLEQLEEAGVVRQSGENVLVFKLLYLQVAAGQLPAEPVELPHGKRGKAAE